MWLIFMLVLKVYDYLAESAACNQTREKVNEFLEKSKKFKLAKAEILNIINIRPASLVEIDSVNLLSFLAMCFSFCNIGFSNSKYFHVIAFGYRIYVCVYINR